MNEAAGRATVVARRMLFALRWLLAAGAIYVSVQYSDDALCVPINLSLFLVPFTVMLALTGRWVWSLSIASAVALFVYGMGELKLKYFYTRLIVADWAFISEPANWTIVRQYPRIYGVLSLFVFGASLLVIDAIWAARRQKPVAAKLRLVSLALAIGLVGLLYQSRHHHQWEVWLDDADCGPGHRCGVLGRLLFSFQMFSFELPTHAGDPSIFIARRGQLPVVSPNEAPQTPDIVLWLNESTFDVRNFKLPGARLPKLAMFDPSPQTRASGLLRTHTFGGKTWLSEFSVLTGLVPDDFGARRSLVFTTIGPKTETNLFKLLKAQGYRTVVLMPTFKRFYGAGRTYETMGADTVLTLRDFREYDRFPGDEWDIAETDRMGAAAQKIIREHRAGPNGAQPLFVYLLSVKEHAPYSKFTRIQYNLDKTGIPKNLAARLTDYIGRLVTLDQAIADMDEFLFEKGARPAVFAWFGDHQAYYEQDSPPYRFDFPEPKNVTQFQVRSNRVVPKIPKMKLMDIAFMPSLVTDIGGVAKDEYFSGLSAMRQLCDGALDDCADKALVDSYKAQAFSREVGLFSTE